MGERFVVVPVGPCNGELEPPDTVFSDPAPENEGAADGVVAGQRDPNTAVPILEYSREPNKYGKTVADCKTLVHCYERNDLLRNNYALAFHLGASSVVLSVMRIAWKASFAFALSGDKLGFNFSSKRRL